MRPKGDGEPPSSPGLEVARLRSFFAFKQAIREEFVEHPDRAARRRRAQLLFGPESAAHDGQASQRLDELDGWLAYLAEVFLDSDAYNAAKHGFGLRGERSAIDVRISDRSVMEAADYSLGYLHASTGDDGRRRWRITTRWYSLETTVALISTAADLIQALWMTARHRYLNTPKLPRYTPGSLEQLLARTDGDPRRLVEMSLPLRYDDSTSS
jgi:hypothetical protein